MARRLIKTVSRDRLQQLAALLRQLSRSRGTGQTEILIGHVAVFRPERAECTNEIFRTKHHQLGEMIVVCPFPDYSSKKRRRELVNRGIGSWVAQCRIRQGAEDGVLELAQ